MKISLKDVRRIIREELINEIAASGLPQAANDFQQVGSLQRGFNDLIRTYKNVIVMQGIVHNHQNAAQMSNEQLDQIAAQYEKPAAEAAARFQQKLAEFLDDSFVEDLRSLSRSGSRHVPQQQPAQQAQPQAQAKPATGTAPDQRATIAPPRM